MSTKRNNVTEVEVTVAGDLKVKLIGVFCEGDPGVRTFRNGDPGYPPTPSEFEIEEIQCDNIFDLLDYADTYYSNKKHKIIEDVLQAIDRFITENHKNPTPEFQKEIDEFKRIVQFRVQFGESLLDDFSNQAADKIESTESDDYSEEYDDHGIFSPNK